MTSVLSTITQYGRIPPDYVEFLLDLMAQYPGLRNETTWTTNDLRNAYEWCKTPTCVYGHGPTRQVYHQHPFVPWAGDRQQLVTFTLLQGPARNARNFRLLIGLYHDRWKALPVVNTHNAHITRLLTEGTDVPGTCTMRDLFTERRPS